MDCRTARQLKRQLHTPSHSSGSEATTYTLCLGRTMPVYKQWFLPSIPEAQKRTPPVCRDKTACFRILSTPRTTLSVQVTGCAGNCFIFLEQAEMRGAPYWGRAFGSESQQPKQQPLFCSKYPHKSTTEQPKPTPPTPRPNSTSYLT